MKFSGDQVTVDTRSGSVVLDAVSALSIFRAFGTPRPFGTTVEEIVRQNGSGAISFMDTTSEILKLIEARALVVAGGEPATASGPRGFADPAIHIAMLQDVERTRAFLDTIRESVRADDVVLDIGTGSGIFAVAAAQAGAKRVFAVEATAIADVASDVFEKNGVADKVELMRGWSTMIDLPEKASLAVSEIVGNEPLSERILEVFLDARKRHFRPDARSIPSKLKLAVALLGPDGDKERAQAGVSWVDAYGVDLSPLKLTADSDPSFKEARVGTLSGRPRIAVAPLLEIDLCAIETLMLDATRTVKIPRDGDVRAVAITWEIELDDKHSINVDLDSNGSHWRLPFWPLSRPIPVGAGDLLDVTYRYRVAGFPDGLSVRQAD
jgi:protein arginine N-methyltransferase 1